MIPYIKMRDCSEKEEHAFSALVTERVIHLLSIISDVKTSHLNTDKETTCIGASVIQSKHVMDLSAVYIAGLQGGRLHQHLVHW